MTQLLTLAEIREAEAALDGVIHRTPCERSHSLSTRLGRDLWLKPEYRQRTGSFKIRGAYNRLRVLPTGSHVVAGSAGNHAQGVALAAQWLGHRATIFMPASASLPKVQATRAYGAEVILGGVTVDDCIEAAAAMCGDEGAVFVPPFDHRAILAGQATAGLEILADVPDASTVLVAIGGGGLCSGVAAAVKLTRPDVTVVGVMARGAASMGLSLAAGEPREVSPFTIADGIALRAPSQLTLDHIEAFVDEVVAVGDEEITQAMLLLLERTKAVVEPAGAAPLAALLSGQIGGDGPAVALLGGGNIDALLLGKLLDHGLGALGRYLRVRAVIPDRPGALSGLLLAVADMGLNVLDVEHHRSGMSLPISTVEVLVVVETRDHEHRASVLAELRDRGFDAQLVE
ncbi:MAG: threonine ammonia-lyase [Actinobacteria bacterium]|jgi:threonine dehydratase|nr:threonine ammonia-lyase [Actinomycetota bacterium]